MPLPRYLTILGLALGAAAATVALGALLAPDPAEGALAAAGVAALAAAVLVRLARWR